MLIKNIIKLIINRKNNIYDVEFKYAFTSVARSYLFEYDDQKIFDIITNNKYESTVLEVVDSIAKNIDYLSLKEIIYEIVDKFDFYKKFILVGDVKNRINRITSIINMFETLANLNYSLEDIYSYLDELITNKYKLEIKELDIIPNSVKIMTIHASKGLEFPICYFASLYSKFNISDLNEKIMYNDKFGIITPYFKEGIGKTFIKELVKESYLKEEISEKIRLLYVALTRAKEKIIIVTSFPDKKIMDISKSKCFLDMLNFAKDTLNSYIKNIEISELKLSKDYNQIKKTNYKDVIPKSKEKIKTQEINIENTIIHKEKISKENKLLIDNFTKEKMGFGTHIHEILELIDFTNSKIDDLEIDNYFKDKIKSFFEQINLKNVKSIYKEYEFLYYEEDILYHGIIDLILEYEDVIKIIDYKLKNIDDENYINQIHKYKEYISKKTNKKIELYLFSILDSKMEQID